MAFDLTTALIGLGTAAFGLLAGIFAPKFKRDETKMSLEVQMAQMAEGSQEKYYAILSAKLEKYEQRFEALLEKVGVQGEEIASLKAELKILRYSETALKAENGALRTDLGRLQAARDALDFENDQQGQEIARLNGRIQELTQKLTENETRLAAALAQLAAQLPATGGP